MTAGAGHRRAAEAIAQAIHAAHPQAEIECGDLLEEVPGWLRRGYPKSYYLLVRHLSLLWAIAFDVLDHPLAYALIRPVRRAWNLLVARRFIRRLRANPPDLVITTHFFSTDVLSACKQAGWLAAPLVVVVTDLHPHRLWLTPQAEAYVVGSEESASVARRGGIAQDRLHVLGIPIRRAFHARYDREALMRLFQLEPGRRTVLVTGGGNTVGPFETVVRALISLGRARPEQMQLLVVCGDNAAAVKRLTALAHRAAIPVRVFGFIETMPEAMALSDLIVTKAGGLTLTEALGCGVPLLIYHVIPGQERLNAVYASRHGAAIIAQRPQEVADAVQRLLDAPDRLATMREAARAIGHPHAAEAIVSEVVMPLLQRSPQRVNSEE